ncbi:MAG: hypothetical protein K2G44_01655 [Clostridia bacterium]|nr:hypothetical protein [Clostridia bacterium]
MLNATFELFMSEYFLTKAVLGKYLENSGELFRALGKIFLIPNGEIERLYRLSENETAKAITTEKEFMQHQRLQKYSMLIGSAKSSNAEWEEVARIKGNAILTAQSRNLILDADASRNVVYTCLSSAATCGVISAIRIMGILQCEGIFLSKNETVGMKTLSKAADWNDSVSTLALLHYCKATREFNMARLRQQVANTPFDELYQTAAAEYGEADAEEIDEVKLLDKSFHAGVLKRETYDPKYARILYSFALYFKDKEKAVFTLNKEQLCAISDLPLKLSHERMSAVDASGVQKVTVKREAEISTVTRALKNCDLRGLSSYRPMCLCCESKYVLNMYAKAIGAKNPDTHIERIYVAELEDYDLEPTQNNVFVRSIDEDRDNRFLLFFYGEISERKKDAVKSILQSFRRAKFHLNSPSVTLNLSAVLPVCFCDEQNAKWLKPYCDEIQLSGVSPDEMPFVIKNILAGKQKLYGVGAIDLIGDTKDVFSGYDVDTAELLIDAAVRARREKGAVITLSREMLQEYAGDSDKLTIGFGGSTYARY